MGPAPRTIGFSLIRIVILVTPLLLTPLLLTPLLSGCDSLAFTREQAQTGLGDVDGDGYVACVGDAPACDCNDQNAAIHPGSATLEVPGNDLDENCDGILEQDADGDHYSIWTVDGKPITVEDDDCNDEDPGIHPGAEEVPGLSESDPAGDIDENCDGLKAYDLDGDGALGYTNQDGVVILLDENSDCNDQDASVSPSTLETCNGLDDDCDFLADDPFDEDDDGYTVCPSTSSLADCNDRDVQVNPGMPEQCNGEDDDCNPTTSETVDQDEDGYSACHGDCDDRDSTISPSLREICDLDLRDEDCDGVVNEQDPSVDPSTGYYAFPDLDGDGYGSSDGKDGSSTVEAIFLCSRPQDGQVTWRGDCDDADSEVHPFAEEGSDSDGKDQDCGGTDAQDPGVPNSNDYSIQAALDIATRGQTLWVGPGTYSELDLEFGNLDEIRLISVELSQATIIDAHEKGRAMYFGPDQGPATVVDGFTIQRGMAEIGGGLMLESSDPTLVNLTIIGNQATAYGGGMYLSDSSPTLTQVILSGNYAGFDGGAMQLSDSSPSLTYTTISGNQALYDGGGMALSDSDPTLTQVILSDNDAGRDGGAMQLSDSSPSLTYTTISGNHALYGGGGMYLWGSRPTLTQVILSGNYAGFDGGAMHLSDSNPILTQVILSGNQARQNGGGMYLSHSNSTLAQVAVSGNQALSRGGGMYLSDSSPEVLNSLIAYNTGNYNVYRENSGYSTNVPSFRFCAVYDPDRDNLYRVTLDSSSVSTNPGLLEVPWWDATEGRWNVNDLHLSLDSNLMNAGDPSILDPDGSRSDIGMYGGPSGDAWDQDGDGWNAYFWPGGINNAPSGFDPADYDQNDLDPAVH